MARRKLQQREKTTLIVGGLVLLLLLLTPVLQHFSEVRARSDKQLREATVRLEQARSFKREIEIERAGHNVIAERLAARSPQFDLYSFTDSCLRELKLKERAELESKAGLYSAQNQDGIELTLRGVSMEELVDLFHRFYASENLIAMQRLAYLRPARDGKGLECRVAFVTPRS